MSILGPVNLKGVLPLIYFEAYKYTHIIGFNHCSAVLLNGIGMVVLAARFKLNKS